MPTAPSKESKTNGRPSRQRENVSNPPAPGPENGEKSFCFFFFRKRRRSPFLLHHRRMLGRHRRRRVRHHPPFERIREQPLKRLWAQPPGFSRDLRRCFRQLDFDLCRAPSPQGALACRRPNSTGRPPIGMQRSPHRFRITGNRPEIRTSSLIRFHPPLFPVAQRANRDLVAGSKLLLRQTERPP